MLVSNIAANFKMQAWINSKLENDENEEQNTEGTENESAFINEMRNLISEMENRTPAQVQDDSSLIESVRSMWGLTDQDNVRIFVVEPGQLRRMPITSFVTRPTTSRRLEQLNRSLTSSMGRVSELERGLDDPNKTESERARAIAGLEENIRRYRREVNQERRRLAVAPRSGVIVVERGATGE
jgi:hypothetical protein